MELLIIGILVIIGGILIFKLIKKILFAAITFVVMIAVLIAGLGGLIYYDLTSIANQENFVLNVQLEEDQEPTQGFTLPYVDGEPNFEELTTTKDYDKELNDSEYRVSIDSSSFYDLVREREISLSPFSFSALNEYEATIDGEEYISLMESENIVVDLVDSLYANYSMPTSLKETIKDQAVDEINSKLIMQDLNEEDFLFALGFTSLLDDKKAYTTLFKLYQDEKINLEPQTISLRFISYIPKNLFNKTLENSTIVE